MRSDQEAQEGQVLGNYQLERLLGEGSMGRVFAARHIRLGRQVALKVLRPQHAHDVGFVRRFFQEARSVNQINHEHIVEIFDFVEEVERGQVYCVMELLRGQSLADAMKEEKLTLSRVQRIGVQVCAALGAAHALGVVHRDVKPDNLFLTHRGGQSDFVKVLDFGVAKILTSEGTNGTLDGTIIGTPTYMAPEQAAGLPVDQRADIYAVGNLLYEMLAGHPPFQAPAFGHLVVQIITQAPPPLPSHLASGEPMPQGLAELVLRCLAKDPESRPQHLSEVTTALLTLSAPAHAVPAIEAEEDIPTRPNLVPVESLLRHPRMPLVAGGMALAMLAGALVWSGVERLLRPEEPVVAAVAPVAVPPITLTVRTMPEGARVIRADTGEALGVTPLVKELPRSDAALGLRLEMAGYVPLERQVRLDSHALLEMPLAKAQVVPTPAAPKAVPAKAAPRKETKRDEIIDPFAQ